MRRLPLIAAFVGTVLSTNPFAIAKRQIDDVSAIGHRDIAHRSLISREKEAEVGLAMSVSFEKKVLLVKDPQVERFVIGIATNLAQNSDLKIPLTIKVVDSPDAFACSIPGGYLYVSSGMIWSVQDEGELAGVLAHEIAHLAARHWAIEMTKQQILQSAMIPNIMTSASSSPVAAAGVPCFRLGRGHSSGFSGSLSFPFLHFNRKSELEADYLGVQYTYKSGYNPGIYMNLLRRIEEDDKNRQNHVPPVFDPMPPAAERIRACQKELKKVIPPSPRSLVSTSQLEDIQARLQSVATKLR